MHGDTYFSVIPELKPESGGILKVVDDVKYFAETHFNEFVSLVADASLNDSNPIRVIDFSRVSIIPDPGQLSALAGYPVKLNPAGLEEKFEKIKNDPETRKISDTLQLVRGDDGLFKVWYQPRPKDSLDKVFKRHPMLLERLKRTLRESFRYRKFEGELIWNVNGWSSDSFKSKYCFRKYDNGIYPKAFSTGFLNEENRSTIIDLINGKRNEAFLKAWKKFIEKIDGIYEFRDYYLSPCMLFFLCWYGRVDFSAFSESNIEKWVESSQVSYRETVESLNALNVWKKCFETTKFPHKEELEKALKELLKVEEDNDIALPNNENCRNRIANDVSVRHFLQNTNDWVGWNNKEEHFDAVVDRKKGYFTLGTWVKYQEWRFKRYFIDGVSLFPDSSWDPLKALEEARIKPKDEFYTDDDDDDD